MRELPLTRFRLKNFKAILDSGSIKFTPLTVFIGTNGSGKSSVIEGLETYQSILNEGLDKAMEPMHGFEHVWNHAVEHELITPRRGRPYCSNPMSYELRCYSDYGPIHTRMEITLGPGGDTLFIKDEMANMKWVKGDTADLKTWYQYARGANGYLGGFKSARRLSALTKFKRVLTKAVKGERRLSDGESLVSSFIGLRFDWQFFSFQPQSMNSLFPEQRASGQQPRLLKDGSNIAAYLNSIRRTTPGVYEGIVEAVQHVLSYARDFQPKMTSELERSIYLMMTEGKFKVPGWLLSTGTLRLLALLALLRHPKPPSLIAIEEIENGLDPATIHLVLSEIRQVVEDRRMQIIATTHSPYLLDLLRLDEIVLVERVDGEPEFTRPDLGALSVWSRQFAPGKLYTMGRLGHRTRK